MLHMVVPSHQGCDNKGQQVETCACHVPFTRHRRLWQCHTAHIWSSAPSCSWNTSSICSASAKSSSPSLATMLLYLRTLDEMAAFPNPCSFLAAAVPAQFTWFLLSASFPAALLSAGRREGTDIVAVAAGSPALDGAAQGTAGPWSFNLTSSTPLSALPCTHRHMD
jgi:hypothetical protein